MLVEMELRISNRDLEKLFMHFRTLKAIEALGYNKQLDETKAENAWYNTNKSIVEILMRNELLTLESLVNMEGKETKSFTFFDNKNQIAYRYLLRSYVAHIDSDGKAICQFHVGFTYANSIRELKDTVSITFKRAN